MEIDVVKNKTRQYELYIQRELILRTEQLSDIVNKIEEYLKMRYLPTQKKGFLGMFK